MSGPDRGADVPRRELRDPQTLRALAHPLRLRLYEELGQLGRATATELGERIGESATNCSWHLRQLAQHGLVEEAGRGAGRRRFWRIVAEYTSIGQPDDDELEAASARDAVVEVFMGREVEAWRAWLASRREDPPEWREASHGTVSNGIWLTAEELATLTKEIRELVARHIDPRADRIDPANRPPGSRPARFVAWAIPYGPPHHAPANSTPPPTAE